MQIGELRYYHTASSVISEEKTFPSNMDGDKSESHAFSALPHRLDNQFSEVHRTKSSRQQNSSLDFHNTNI